VGLLSEASSQELDDPRRDSSGVVCFAGLKSGTFRRSTSSMRPIYLDHNSTTPIDVRVLEAMLPYFREGYGNPSSAHASGRQARRALENARETVARLLDAQPDEVIFTSGATEANNLALLGLSGPTPGRRDRQSHRASVGGRTIEPTCQTRARDPLAPR